MNMRFLKTLMLPILRLGSTNRMKWQPLPEVELWNLLNSAWQRMSVPQRRLWEAIRIDPEKWVQHPHGDLGDGFWAVGILGRTVVWYNDIEGGFNRSIFTSYGSIGVYGCNQDELQWTIQHLLDLITTGEEGGGFAGPSLPDVYNPNPTLPPSN